MIIMINMVRDSCTFSCGVLILTAAKPRGLTSTAVLLLTPSTGDTIRTTSQGGIVTRARAVMDTHVVRAASCRVLETASLLAGAVSWKTGVSAASEGGVVTGVKIFFDFKQVELSLTNRQDSSKQYWNDHS